MSGFTENSWRFNFLISMDYVALEKLHPRGKRLDFEEACLLL